MQVNVSEVVSTAHPDRLCDALAAKLIDDIQHKDGPVSHAAVEVFATHSKIIFAGEVHTTLEITPEYLKSLVAKVYDDCGYIPAMRNYWNKDEVVLPEDLEIVNEICAQSPDIARATTELAELSGYNDQGIFYSSSESRTNSMMGSAKELSTLISEELFKVSRTTINNNLPVKLGPDNKVVVSLEVADDGYTPISVQAVTIAAAHDSASETIKVVNFIKLAADLVIREWATSNDVKYSADSTEWVINGTGRFVVHGQISDTSMTGRKLAVNHPSAGPWWESTLIGGGSLVKGAHASDLVLNIVSRFIANCIVNSGLATYAVVATASAIGQVKPMSLSIHGDFNDSSLIPKCESFFAEYLDWHPVKLAEFLGIFSGSFYDIVRSNFFGHPQVQLYESPDLITPAVKKLLQYIK